ncbi:hypothetical protein CF326_g9577 [Tilletia indica]|nr:hypothetical protein CF326_g9577 [Tilletia indica]
MAVREASSTFGIPVGCCRYKLPGWFKPTNEAHARWAKRAFDDALTSLFANAPLPRDFTIFVHTNDNEARQKAVDVYTAHTTLHLALANSSLVLAGDDAIPKTTLAPPRAGLPLSPRYVPARVVFGAPITEKEAHAALASTFSRARGIFVIEAWSVHEIHRGIPNFIGELVVLLFVPPPPPGQRPAWAPVYTGMSLPVTKKQREGIPGFIAELEQEGDALWFQFRPKWCWGCKGLTTFFHLTSRCVNTAVDCGLCHKRGHTGISCPRKTSVDAALAFAPPSLAGPSAPSAFPAAPSVPGFEPELHSAPNQPSPSAMQLVPASATTSATAPPQSAFTFAAYARWTQPPSGPSASTSTNPFTDGSPATTAPGASTSTPGRGNKRPSSSSSASVASHLPTAGPSSGTGTSSAAGPSSSADNSPSRPIAGKGKGKGTAKTPKAPKPTPRPDGFVQTALNFGPNSTPSSSTAPRSTAPHSPKRVRREG